MPYSKKNFKELLWRSNNVWVRVPKQVSLQCLRRNTGNDGADVTSSGRLFPTLGPAEANGRSPTVTSRDGSSIRYYVYSLSIKADSFI